MKTQRRKRHKDVDYGHMEKGDVSGLGLVALSSPCSPPQFVICWVCGHVCHWVYTALKLS